MRGSHMRPHTSAVIYTKRCGHEVYPPEKSTSRYRTRFICQRGETNSISTPKAATATFAERHKVKAARSSVGIPVTRSFNPSRAT